MWEKTALAFEVNPTALNLPKFDTLGAVVSAFVTPIVSLAGLLLFAYLIMGGFKYMTSSGDDKAIAEARKIITHALTGMLIIFASFWIIRIIETILGLNITGFNP